MQQVLEVLKSFNPKQWAAMFIILAGCLSAYAWVENRYSSRDSTEMILENLIVIDSKLSAIITTQFNKTQIEQIQENAKLYEAQMRRYREEKTVK